MMSKYGNSIITDLDKARIVNGYKKKDFEGWGTFGQYRVYAIKGAFSITYYEDNVFGFVSDGVQYGLEDVSVDDETNEIVFSIVLIKTEGKIVEEKMEKRYTIGEEF